MIASAAATIRRRLAMPAPIWLVVALGAGILAAPAWLYWLELNEFSLHLDDFAYIAYSRDWPTTWTHLLEPHNSHVVPIFRLWTFLLVTIAGRLANLQVVFAAASYLGLIAAMAVLGIVVARETRTTAAGLVAMALLGISTVLHRVVTWFSAGQALWAGAAILLTVAFAQAWSQRGGAARLTAAALTAFLAPAIWSGGLLAGPAASAYLVCKKERRALLPALLLLAATLTAALLIGVLAWDQIRATKKGDPDVWPRPVQAVLHTAQALVEACICGNLGFEAVTTERQAITFLIGFIVLYAWSRRSSGPWNSLEATGAAIAIGSCLLIYFFRGNVHYRNLRTTTDWYHAIPQVGTILFLAGWWSALRPAPESVVKPRMMLAQAAAVAVFVVAYCWIQSPRQELLLIHDAPPFAPGETAAQLPSRALLAGRAYYFKGELHDRQLRAFVRLDNLDRMLFKLKASPESLRPAFGRVSFPGIPDEQSNCDALSLLTPRPPNPGARAELASRSVELVELLQPEPATPPPWLDR